MRAARQPDVPPDRLVSRSGDYRPAGPVDFVAQNFSGHTCRNRQRQYRASCHTATSRTNVPIPSTTARIGPTHSAMSIADGLVSDRSFEMPGAHDAPPL